MRETDPEHDDASELGYRDEEEAEAYADREDDKHDDGEPQPDQPTDNTYESLVERRIALRCVRSAVGADAVVQSSVQLVDHGRLPCPP
jgi:hypothetical protein